MRITIRVAGGLSHECDLWARNFLGVRIPELSSQCSGSFAMSLRTIGVACFLLKRENYTGGTASVRRERLAPTFQNDAGGDHVYTTLNTA